MSFVISMSDPVVYPGPPPAQADVVVIGGGIAGVASALFLARAGQRVVLCEKGRIAGEQSSRNWGWIRQQGRDPAELPIMIEAMRLWEGFSSSLGPDLGFTRCGVGYFSHDREKLGAYESWVKIAREHGLESFALARKSVDAVVPNAAGWMAGLVTPSDARAEPWTAVRLLAHLAAASGVTIVEDCAVRGLDLAGGKLAGVVTEQGPIRAARVLLAGGAWSSLFAGAQGVRLPQLSVLSSVLQTEPAAELPFGLSGADEEFAWRRRRDGGYTLAASSRHDFHLGPDAVRNLRAYVPQIRRDVSDTTFRLRPPVPGYPDGWRTKRRWNLDALSPFEAVRILDPEPNVRALGLARLGFTRAFPQLGLPEIVRSWGGMIDVMPDTVPVLDESPIAGFFIATGLSGHGFGIGPAVGRVMADLMQGRAPGHDLTRFRFSRFSDGSRMDLGPTF